LSDDTTRQDPPRFDDARGGGIPPYRLLEKLGEGGMGEVWLAEQSEPVRRRVAIKLIKSGMDTKLVIARFEAERQALAMMDHPTIAKVFDAGETPRGLPFFAMEYVVSEPITTYCDRVMLPNEARLQLFRQVCDGVQHAHQKGIIHRDLKPSNVMVSIENDRPLPKIIDFGVAKATAQRLTDRTLFTEIGVLIGTPGYISPEQAQMSGLDIDTRADVYALGVMLSPACCRSIRRHCGPSRSMKCCGKSARSIRRGRRHAFRWRANRSKRRSDGKPIQRGSSRV
jgi:serine/threonine protein kinase